MSYSYVSSSDLELDFDLNLDILNVRVDSTTKNVQISVTDSSYESTFYFSTKLYNINNNSFSSSCDSETSVSTTPVSLSGTILDELGKFVEIHLIDITIPRTYLIHVACIDSTLLYYITIAKVG
jgi:hypothetical protein